MGNSFRFNMVKWLLLVATAFLILPFQARASMPDTFVARVTLELCPEYKLGGVSLEVDYTIGENPTLYPATVIDQTIDVSAETGTFDLRFPATYGTLPFHVVAYCKSGRGTSDASNKMSVSNCDSLAKFDTDADGMANNQEDRNCDNSFSPGDYSNPDNVDTDGDGVRDLVELVSGTDPTNPGNSPRPYIFSSAVFDPDENGNANPVVWRPSSGTWYIKDFVQSGNYLAFGFGLNGDTPFTYTRRDTPSNVGVIRNVSNSLRWIFRGRGIPQSNGQSTTDLSFGIFGDNIVLGPWEEPGATNPAVARLYNGQWYFYILLHDGSIRAQTWGGNGDIPKVQDHDGDGIFDIAVFRPSEQKTYIIRSSDQTVDIYTFGSGTADHTVKGDYDADGIDDISFWEPMTGLFTTMTSANGFNDVRAREADPRYYLELPLGLYVVHLPLNWNRQSNRFLFTVVDHATGYRYWRAENNPDSPPQAIQWGIAGDHQG